MSYKADYHIHSCYSDGTMRPVDIVRMYKEKEYDVIALTDHDGVDGVKEAEIAGEALKIKVVPGVEISSSMNFYEKSVELHILGYHIDTENQLLLEKLKELRAYREDRNRRLLTFLNEHGYLLTEEDLLQQPGQTYVGKPNFARAIREKGYVIEDMWDVFDQVEKKKISVGEAIEVIRQAGGIAVLAHPMKIRGIGEKESQPFWEALDEITSELKRNGLKGMECYHPSASAEDSLRLVSLAGKYHLHITEGSDFHGE